MAIVRFISTDLLKQRTPINGNVSADILQNYILKAQDTHIHMILGTNLYNYLKTQVQANTVIGNYKTLMDDYIIPALIEYSFYEALPFISLKLTNKSIVRGTSEYSTEADLDDLKYLRSSVRDIAEFYGERCVRYIKENSSLFPQYSTNSGLDEMQPNKTTYFTGVYIPGSGRSDCSFGLGLGKDLNI